MPENKVSLYRIEKDDLKSLFDHFKQSHYKIIGHIYRDGALMLDAIDSFEEMATGYEAIQKAGTFKLEKKDSESLFQYTVGPQSFKKYLYPPKRKLWSAEKDGKTFKIQKSKEKPPKMVFWGIRSCEIKAIEILDRIFIKGEYVNDWYKEAREKLVLVGVNCTNPSSTCFCTTTRSGPKIKTDHDISITELIEKEKPSYVISLPEHVKTLNIDIKAWKKASKEEIDQAEERIGQAADKMKLKFQPQDAVQTLKNNLEHYHWEEVAAKCLSCANCTLVCPTCFCSTVEDITSLTGDHSERWIKWDSCFNIDHSYIHGGNIRKSIKSRYRQWLIHKFSTWYDQYGTFGCVGCGRCITWCPVGIDLTEEFAKIKSEKNE